MDSMIRQQNTFTAPAAGRRGSPGIRIALAALLILLLTALPFAAGTEGTAVYAFNGLLEDCDSDGYDDATGAPVPWYGFDQTRGDQVPSDWDGKAGSYKKNAGGSTSADKTDTTDKTDKKDTAAKTDTADKGTASGKTDAAGTKPASGKAKDNAASSSTVKGKTDTTTSSSKA